MQEYEQEEYEGGNIQPKELKLVNSGAFGCIYSPNLTCKGAIGSANYITKIQKSKRSIIHELRISERIRKIAGYAKYFAPVLSSCNVRIAKDRLNDLRKCEVFENESEEKIKSSSYISMKIRYVGNHDLKDHLLSNVTASTFLQELVKTHSYVLKGIQKLFANNIVHYDLKYNNIIMDKTRNMPIIIDFGQSWSIDELRTADEINAAFFVFDQYDYWCIDILICNYAIQKIGLNNLKTSVVTEAEIHEIYDVFIYGREPKYESGSGHKKILNDVFRYGMLQTPQKMLNYRNTLNEYLSNFINKLTWHELYEDLLKYSGTWDCYSVAVIYMNMVDDLFLSNPEIYTQITSKYQYLQKYVILMESVLYSAPNNRPPIQTIIKELDIMRKFKV